MDSQSSGPGPTGAAQPGLVAGLGGVAKNLFGLLVSRIELAACELGEARDNLVRLLLVGALGVVALWLGAACWTALVVVLAWDALGWKILLLVAIFYTVLALVVLRRAQAMLARDPLSLPATLAELRGDRDALL
ncbi:phage holin family protein [Noviherbaspirillum sp. UKPF54]|uniref:phage holin family protein n=1 Tax=Noviherbaspirillum sp. UKPF54 TaxID=2601898 RepID=UPI0011B123DA|nr:phage holin family protein [Noviherbaspirillum sp. UKPF54]QDZ29887.1 phage holin family protein [Noviherbaspirillum sp. UKPF54]